MKEGSKAALGAAFAFCPDMIHRPRILLVDPDAAIRSSLVFALELDGFDVEAFATGEALLDLPRLPIAELIVLEHRLPGENGLEILASLRQRGFTLGAIILTTAPSARLRAQTARSGALLVEKPLLCDGLTSAIRSRIGNFEEPA